LTLVHFCICLPPPLPLPTASLLLMAGCKPAHRGSHAYAHRKAPPLIVYLTGAHGVVKTTLVNALHAALHNEVVRGYDEVARGVSNSDLTATQPSN
jgi:hypothetical protein